MKFTKLKSGLLISALTVSAVGAGAAQAQTNAYATAFTTAVTYQNVGTAAATINLDFYAENGAATVAAVALPSLPANAATSIFVGNVQNLNQGFTGSGVLSSDQPLVATLVQVPAAASSVKNRALSNGFSAGSPRVLFATVLKNQFGTSSKFSIQNTDSVNVNLSVKFFAVGSATPTATIDVANLPPNAAKYFDAGTLPQLTAGSFNGSVVVDVVKTGGTTAGSAVGSALELSTNGTSVSAFEGVPSGGTTVYMASALCNTFNANSAFAIQNTSTTTVANVVVNFSNGTSQPATIAPNGKASILGCASATSAPFNGAAKIVSNVPIIAIGKITGGGLSTAYVGSTTGSDRVAVPYVRWSNSRYDLAQRDRQRTNLTIQNIGTPLAAGAVVVNYYDNGGTLVGTHQLAAIATDAKVNSNPNFIGANGTEFGYYSNGTGGSAVVVGPAGSQLVVVGRVNSFPASGLVGEDTTGIAIQ